MIKEFLPILIQIVVAIGFAAGGLIVSVLLGKVGKRSLTKDSAYECGMLPIGKQQPRFSVKFYLVAMLFILFDIEIVFMYPWAVVYRDFLTQFKGSQGLVIFFSMLSFVSVLLVGYLYALKKGAIDWNQRND